MVDEKLTGSKIKEIGPEKSEKEKEIISTGSDKMELNKSGDKEETHKGNDTAEMNEQNGTEDKNEQNGTEDKGEAQKENCKMEVNEPTADDTKKEEEATEPKKDNGKERSGPSSRCIKEETGPRGKAKINVIDPKTNFGRGLTKWEAANLHMELKGEKGRLRPFERKNPRRVTFILRKNEVVVGRSEECDIIFQEIKGMGDKHCKITFTADGRAFLHPLYMSGLTYLNGEMIRSRKTLSHNDIITIVKMSYRFTYPDSSKHSIRGKCADSKKAKEKDEEQCKTNEKKKVPEKLPNGKTSEKIPIKGQTAEKKSPEVKQTGKKYVEKKPTSGLDILKRLPDFNSTRKQIAEIMELLDETQNCAQDLEESLKNFNSPRISNICRYLDGDFDESSDEGFDVSDMLGDDPAAKTWEKFLEKEISDALRQSSSRLGETSHQGKKIKIYKKRSSTGAIATSCSQYRNGMVRLIDIDSDESSSDSDNEEEEAVVTNAQADASSIYLELLQCLRNYYRNKRSLSRISTLMFYLDAVYKSMDNFNRIKCPYWITQTRDHREMVESSKEAKESLKRMYRKFKEDRCRIEREPFGQLDPVKTLQSVQEFQRETPRRRLIARRKRCDKTVQTVAADEI